MLLEVKDKKLLEDLVIESQYRPVLLYFWSSLSRVSQSVLYKVADIGKNLEDDAIIGLINIDHNKHMASKFDVKNMPSLLALKNGDIVNRFCGIGLNNENRIMMFIEDL